MDVGSVKTFVLRAGKAVRDLGRYEMNEGTKEERREE